LNELLQRWSARGVALDFGIGIDVGYATLSVVGLKGRAEYTAVGTVLHTASALSDLARRGQILTTRRVAADLAPTINTADLGEKSLPGFARPISIVEVSGGQLLGSLRPPMHLSGATAPDPLSEREHEVAALIAQGLSNRQIAEKLIIAEATAVRHVANILNKLGFHSRAQVAVWAVERRVGA
jgi:DNA-binding NarL/FixJ family response regulator